MKLVSLSEVPFAMVMDCFKKAFANYFVKMPTDPLYYQKRFEVANVRYDLSYGLLNESQLVAFVIHAVDQRSADYVAFNTGTGVDPQFQRQGLIQDIYEHALPALRAQGVNKLRLEVIQDNATAIRCYQKIGMSVIRDYRCFKGTIEARTEPLNHQSIIWEDIQWSQVPHQEFQSWDHHSYCLARGQYQFYHTFDQGEPHGFLAINRAQGYLAQAEVFSESTKSWDQMFASIGQICSDIKINNVDSRLKSKLAAIQRAQLNNTVDQYEMEMVI